MSQHKMMIRFNKFTNLLFFFSVGAAGKIDLLVYYLPIFTTLCLLMRCRQQNDRNKKKHGTAWATYSERVPANLIPKIY